MAEGIGRVCEVHQSRRFARGARNLRDLGMPPERDARGFDEHDDALGIPLGRGALQQRGNPVQEHAIWREL